MRRLSLRANQLLLVVGTALPLIVLAVWLSVTLIAHERKTLADNAIYRVRAFMSAVDAELKGTVASLQALATSERIDVRDFAGFYLEARRFLQSQPQVGTISLALPDGQIIVNTRVQYGAPMERVNDRESFDKVLSSQAPVIGDLVSWQSAKSYTINVRVPIRRNGEVAYVLSANVDPDIFATLIERQKLSSDWANGLVDRKGKLIARRPAREPNASASPDFLDAVQESKVGWYRGHTIDGNDTYTAHFTSDYTGWSVGLAIPVAQVYAPITRASWMLGIGFLFSLALAFAFAYAMSRRISSPISSLASAARSMGTASPPSLPTNSDISEVADLASALRDAENAVREREALLEREKAALQASDKAKDEFLAMLSHELRNPLGVLTTSVHLLRVGKPDAELLGRVQGVIERQLKQMTRLIEDLLDVSRVTMGKASLKREVFDLSELVSRSVAAWTPSQNGGRRIAVNAQSVWINADRARIEQVFANLLDNAHKFSPAGKPISVSVGKEGNSAVLTVADEGEGIAPNMLERVFGLFVQGEQGPDRARGGMGVGLALVRRLVEMHDGSVTAASDGTGKGATFVVRLPAVAPVNQSQPEPEVKDTNARRILVIEDNSDAREMLEVLLKLDGHHVETAEDGNSGLQRFSQADPEIVFVDIGLPDMEGYRVARELRERATRRIVLVAMTGYGQVQDERRAVDAGFNLHLVKPVTVEHLQQVIASL